jgi:hypothetical protein
MIFLEALLSHLNGQFNDFRKFLSVFREVCPAQESVLITLDCSFHGRRANLMCLMAPRLTSMLAKLGEPARTASFYFEI